MTAAPSAVNRSPSSPDPKEDPTMIQRGDLNGGNTGGNLNGGNTGGN